MRTEVVRIRTDYAPLSVAVSIACVSGSSPVTQVYDPETMQYEPDRSLTPVVLLPDVTANARDGSWPNPRVNPLLADMVWLVDGVDISTLPEWQGKYTVEQSGDNRGAISVYRNNAPGEAYALSFKAVFADTRTGLNIPVETVEIVLSVTDKSDDGYSIGLDDDQIIQYNPFKDRLRLYQYKVAHGLEEYSETDEQEAMDANAYIRTIEVSVYKGGVRETSGYTLSLYRVGSTGSLTQLQSGVDEVVEIATDHVTLDLRLVTKSDYLLRAYVEDEEVAAMQFSVNRVYPVFRASPSNGTSISPGDTFRFDKATVDCDGNIVECPGSVIRMVWMTDSASKTGVSHNEGDETVFLLSSTGIGETYSDDWLDVYLDVEQKPALSIAVDGTDTWTDDEGNVLIFN